MNDATNRPNDTSPSRREFLRSAAMVSAALAMPLPRGDFHVGGRDEIKVGLIGCGGRGTGAAANALDADPAVRIVSIGDVFKERVDACRGHLEGLGDRSKVAEDHCFVGFDAIDKVLASGIDLIILATPPGFRPRHIKAAVDAGKHIFAEKPVATDATGVRMVLDAAKAIDEKKLGFVCGTQRRHQGEYLETMQRIQDGAIGEVVSASCYWNQGSLWSHERRKGDSEMEWQLRNWLYFCWISGDHIVEQHVHNLDVMNWAMGATPVKAYGMGGRQVRVEPVFGNIFDHFAIEYEYPGGRRGTSFCRQIEGTASRVAEYAVGTQGRADCGGRIEGKNAWRVPKKERTDPYVQEHIDLITSIRAGKPLNEARRIAESTLTAIMGRMSAYSGQEVTWDFALNSKLDLFPKELKLGDLPIAPVPIPGRTPLV